MKPTHAFFAAALFLVMAAGCNTITTPQPSLNPGSLSAEFPGLGGAEFISTSATVTDVSSDYQIVATQDASVGAADVIQMTIPKNPGGTVPYTVTEVDGSDLLYFNNTSGNSYEGNSAQGYCTITVTQIDPTFEGNFSGRTICNSTPDSIRDIANGVFNASY